MILTRKIKHGRDFSDELKKARKVASFAILTHSQTTKDVKHFGLKANISNQILRKYSRDRKAKHVSSVKLAVSGCHTKVDRDTKTIYIPCLKLYLRYEFTDNFEKINQIEFDKEYAYVAITVVEQKLIKSRAYIGIDRNTTGHIAVVSDPETGKVIKLGKSALHIHQKYKNIRKYLQHNGKYDKMKQIKNRESRIVRDLNHKVARKIVDIAKESSKGIKLEDLTGIRNSKTSKSFRYAKNSWSFYQLQTMIEYKAKLLGVEVAYVDPRYTSQECSRCGLIGNRDKKEFTCPHCGHVDHADSNAGFNIAKRPRIDQLHADSDVCKGTTDSPKMAMSRIQPTVKHKNLGS
jgi:putative transposase